jgi:DNA-binding LacI/PurR family transcriptional regulator
MADTANGAAPSNQMGGAPQRERRPANMVDVARRAGVSHQTVSRVLNGSGAVRESTRRRVNAAIDELGYRRNLTARALATHRSRTLGVVCFDSTLYGPASMLYGIEHAARAMGYYVSVASESTVDTTTLPMALDRLAEQSVEGVVVIAPLPETRQALQRLRGTTPIVAVDGTGGLGLPVVSVDQYDGARQVTAHLLDQGASTVWHVTGAPGWSDTDARLAGWRAELAARGCRIPEPLPGNWTPASGYAAGMEMARRPDVDAVFVANDQMALGLLRAFSEAGRCVPGDVLVAGFDDVPEAEYYSPPLTTVRQDFATVGRRSVEMLIERIEDPIGRQSDEQPTLVAAELVVRQSSRRPN